MLFPGFGAFSENHLQDLAPGTVRPIVLAVLLQLEANNSVQELLGLGGDVDVDPEFVGAGFSRQGPGSCLR